MNFERKQNILTLMVILVPEPWMKKIFLGSIEARGYTTHTFIYNNLRLFFSFTWRFRLC